MLMPGLMRRLTIMDATTAAKRFNPASRDTAGLLHRAKLSLRDDELLHSQEVIDDLDLVHLNRPPMSRSHFFYL
jgi:hypothetical protein